MQHAVQVLQSPTRVHNKLTYYILLSVIMPRESSRRKAREVIDDDDEVDELAVENGTRKAARLSHEDYDEEVEEDGGIMTFTQQCDPDRSQSFPVAKESERQNLMERLTYDQRQKIIVDMSRLVLFRAFAGEPIDRLKCCKMAGVPPSSRISTAVWEQVQSNLQNVFGLDLVKPPQFMALPKKYDDRFYCVNIIPEDEEGRHSKAIHSVHSDAAVEKGLLMVVLAFCFCKGNPRPGSQATMRWITDLDLYRLLHSLDENLPQDPPSVTNRKVLASQGTTSADGMTPKVDLLMEKFVAMDYLLKIKADDTSGTDDVTLYAMGPRAALEVGRRQIILFCSEILGEAPDPTMLQELEDCETQFTAATQ